MQEQTTSSVIYRSTDTPKTRHSPRSNLFIKIIDADSDKIAAMSTMRTPTGAPRTAFFYGTLMAPQILDRVCHGTNPNIATHHLTTSPAMLPNHRRHRVRGADYPAIIPHSDSSVRGVYVAGLTDADIWRLDMFEGSEYERKRVLVRKLVGPNGEEDDDDGEEVETETYLWIGDRGDLEDEEWDFQTFRREKMKFWVGDAGAAEYAGEFPSLHSFLICGRAGCVLIRGYYVEVDEAVGAAQQDGTGGRGAGGHITKALEEEQTKDEVLKNAV